MTYNVYMIGVGGQGIGLLSEVLIRACDHAGLSVCGVDTHGLAQRGGTVESHLRIGTVFSPLVQPGHADCVIALERQEAMRGLCNYAREKGSVVYYDAQWQPLSVRMGKAQAQTQEELTQSARDRSIALHRVFDELLEDTRMQNVVIVGYLSKYELIPGVTRIHYEAALRDLIDGHSLEKNMTVFNRHA